MAVSVKQFKARRPEFRDIEDEFVSLQIAEATRWVNANVFGTKTNDGISALAAHYVAISPLGEQAKFITKDGETIYSKQFNMLKRIVASGHRVI